LAKKFPILDFFRYDHLPERLQAVSRPHAELAYTMALAGEDKPAECAAGLRKLLEAKDCFVRAAL
jgi:hypothetical protein